MQLRLLLESIDRWNSNVFNVTVSYNYLGDVFMEGYEKLISEGFNTKWECQKDNVFLYEGDRNKISNEEYQAMYNKWLERHNFSPLLSNMVGKRNKYTNFLCDDSVYFGSLHPSDISVTMDDRNVVCFSTWLGLNTTYFYMEDKHHKLDNYTKWNNTVMWEWREQEQELGFPSSINGNIFRTDDILKYLEKMKFGTVNKFEAIWSGQMKKEGELMAAYNKSIVVNIPMNRIQKDYPGNRCIENQIDEGHLNEKYLDDYIIDYDSIDFSNIIGPHQELDFKLKRKN